MGVQKLYEEHKANGLEIMWVVGEDKDKNLPSWEWIEDFIEEKGTTFSVVRDFKFLQTYGKIKPHSSSLPHQYIIDAKTMELVHASGGVNQESEDKVLELLGQ